MKNQKGEYNWLFTFVGGGFNNVWATTLEEAVKQATKEFSSLTPDPASFRKATDASFDHQNRMGWMLTM